MQKAFFNPEILGIGKEMESMKEGCLSFPGLWLMVSRPKQAMIKYWDEEGEEHIQRRSRRLVLLRKRKENLKNLEVSSKDKLASTEKN